MQQPSTSFRLRPSLAVGALCILLSPSVPAADISQIPPASLLISALQYPDTVPYLPSCSVAAPFSTLLAASLQPIAWARAEPGFISLDDYVSPPAMRTPDTVLGAGPPALIPTLASLDSAFGTTAPKTATHRISELTEKAKILSAHIAEKFKVDLNRANEVVVSALRTAGTTGLSPALVLAVIAVESRFVASAKNGGARGLMQIVPFWHKEKVAAAGGPVELMKIDKNIATGGLILRECIDKSGSVFEGLVRYNASPHAKRYSEEVLKQKSWFEAVMLTTS